LGILVSVYLDILVLAHLAHRPAHGYEIKKREMARLAAGNDQPYGRRLLAFQIRQAETELSWVAELAAEEAGRLPV
jgi:hypothetical protein